MTGKCPVAIEVLKNCAMADRIIVMPGSASFDFAQLWGVARELGFRVEAVDDIREIAASSSGCRDIAAVLFHYDALGPRSSWFDALWVLQSELPGVRLIPCHGFADSVDWELLDRAGAWHSLRLPLKENELRQCLGFIWEAQKRAGDAAVEPELVRSIRRRGPALVTRGTADSYPEYGAA